MDASHLMSRVEAMRASLRRMVQEADRTIAASHALRYSDAVARRDHLRALSAADAKMRQALPTRKKADDISAA